jgi:hypothetical protein
MLRWHPLQDARSPVTLNPVVRLWRPPANSCEPVRVQDLTNQRGEIFKLARQSSMPPNPLGVNNPGLIKPASA